MGRTSTVHITVPKWEKFNPRRDLKATSWLRLQNTIFENPQFFDLTQGELLFWIYVLCLASKAQSGDVTVHVTHAVRVGRFDEKVIHSAIEKLEQLQCVRVRDVEVTQTERARTATNERNERNERNITNMADEITPHVYDLELIFENYPKRAGDQKKKTGLECLLKKVTTQGLFEKALQASQNYFKHCEAEGITGTKFVKQFSTFFGKDDTWLEYAEYTPSLVARSPQAKPAFNRAEQRSQANKETLKNYIASLEGDQNEI